MQPNLTPKLEAFATVHTEMSFLSVHTTFGTPQDIALASLQIEPVFAADVQTKAGLAQQTGLAHGDAPLNVG